MAFVRITHSPAQTSSPASQPSPKRRRRQYLVASSLWIAALLAGCAEGGGASEQDFVPQDGSADITTLPDSGKDASPDTSADADAASDAPDAADEKAVDAPVDAPPDGSCATGMKLCKGACVDATDPANGCAGASCDPCNLANATAKCDATGCVIDTCNAGFSDCNDDPSDGCESNTNTDPGNCGGCGDACVVPHATANCLNGTCGIEACDTGFDNCDFDNKTGCETNLKIDPTSCGACETDCTLLGMNACVQGVCGVTACPAGTGDCDITVGCETNVTTSMQHCGYCFNECVLPNATPVCLDSTCRVQTCNQGWDNCDKVHANGCEVETSKSTNHCGACENAECSDVNNSSKSCKDGKCTYTCTTGFADCNGPQPGVSDDGCETPVSADPNNCGGCGLKCNNPHGTSDCQAGLCVPTCELGWDNCNHDASDGCEASLLDSTATCGDCNTTCTNPNGSTSCVAGACVPVCSAGFSDCDGNPINGCETSTQTSTNHCGACGTQCLNLHGTTACQSGVCVPNCAQGFANCNGDPIDGCEAVTTNDPDNCGGCGNKCTNPNGSAACSNSVCTAGCDLGWGDCDSVAGCETNTTSTTDHCGGCFKPCTNPHGTTSCEASVCKPLCAQGYDSCDSDLTDGCETPIATDPNNCGACGAKCVNAHGGVACVNSTCAPDCSIGWKDCNGNPSDGCETGVNTSVSNCGGCGVQCTNSNGSTACVGGLCSPTCDPGFASCDNNPKNGCEIQTSVDPNNCGGCGSQCTNPHGTVGCSNSVCTPGCNAGWASCDGDPKDGCETSIYDINNCGGCGTKCSTVNASATCPAGTCVLTCNNGFANCDNDLSNGCEVNLSTSLGNCGMCGRACLNDHGGEQCLSGSCVPTCDSGWGNCDGNPVNGCETSTLTTTAHCGACSQPCVNEHGSTSCSAGVCVPGCSPGFGNCDGIASNGCESQTTIDPNNCGGCGIKCTNAHGGVACSNSVCVPTCLTGFANCDGDPNDGCETPTSADVDNCGGCGIKCSSTGGSPSCVSGVCGIACSAGTADCNNNAADGCEIQTVTNLAHCGGCNKPCTNDHGTTSCQSSVCVPSCSAGYASCDSIASNGCETQTSADPNNCGGCGTKCLNDHGGVACSNSVCVPSCNTGYANCDGDPKDGCETPTSSDINNCGGCNVVCNSTNGVPSCSSGACAITCNAGFENCDNNLSNGCEKNVTSDPNNCGACNAKCTALNGTNTCQSSTCVPGCNPGFASCDNNPNNGCEAQVSSDPNNCGGCGTKCLNDHGGVACSNSLCVPTCNSGYADCDGDPKDGCETPTSSDIYNCGGCNVVCNSTNGAPSCNSGTCAIECSPGFENCDNNLANGCEKNVTSDPNNCGDCNVTCTALNGTNTCQSSVCVPGCNPGYATCDNNPNNGCEVQISSDLNNCGGCGNICSEPNAQTSCSGGTCAILACYSQYYNHDGDPTNGCEYHCEFAVPSTEVCDGKDNDCDGVIDNGFDKLNDPNNCGTCGIQCGTTTGGLCCNGICHTASASDCGACGQSCTQGMLVINELQMNPKTILDTQAEWLELYNPGSKPIDIRGFTLKDLGTTNPDNHVVTSTIPVVVPAMGYAVLGINSNKTLNGNVDLVYQYSAFSLGNSGDEVVLVGLGGVEIDRFVYASAFVGTEGFSKELSLNHRTYLLNDNASNWCAATQLYYTGNYGTPGAINTCTK